MLNIFANPVLRHWRGLYNLFQTAVFVLIGLRICIGIIQSLMQKNISNTVLGAWLAFSLIILVWQIVGGWRACDNHAREGGGIISGWLGYSSLLITLTLTIVQMIDGVTGTVELQSAPPPDNIKLTLQSDNTVLLVDKPLDWKLFGSFKATLQQHDTITTVALDSSGGYVFTARAMARLIEQHNLDTHVDRLCYSACTVVFLAGRQRTANIAAELGFHRYSLQTSHQLQTIDINQELNKDREYFIERGVSTDFVDSLFQANPDSLWKPERQQLIDAGVVTNLQLNR